MLTVASASVLEARASSALPPLRCLIASSSGNLFSARCSRSRVSRSARCPRGGLAPAVAAGVALQLRLEFGHALARLLELVLQAGLHCRYRWRPERPRHRRALHGRRLSAIRQASGQHRVDHGRGAPGLFAQAPGGGRSVGSTGGPAGHDTGIHRRAFRVALGHRRRVRALVGDFERGVGARRAEPVQQRLGRRHRGRRPRAGHRGEPVRAHAGRRVCTCRGEAGAGR